MLRQFGRDLFAICFASRGSLAIVGKFVSQDYYCQHRYFMWNVQVVVVNIVIVLTELGQLATMPIGVNLLSN